MALLTIDEVKILLQISVDNTEKDDFIEINIPIVEDFIRKYCKDDYTEFPAGLKMVGAQMIAFNLANTSGNINSEKIGESYSVSYNNTYPEFILKQLNSYTKIKVL